MRSTQKPPAADETGTELAGKSLDTVVSIGEVTMP
jgi:hypothetical protein